jgi:hypothetical protein
MRLATLLGTTAAAVVSALTLGVGAASAEVLRYNSVTQARLENPSRATGSSTAATTRAGATAR